MPMETIRPVMPARSKLGATDVCPSAEMIAHKHHGREHQARDHHEAQRSVVEQDVKQHQNETGDAGAEARDERRVAQRGRDRLVRSRP